MRLLTYRYGVHPPWTEGVINSTLLLHQYFEHVPTIDPFLLTRESTIFEPDGLEEIQHYFCCRKINWGGKGIYLRHADQMNLKVLLALWKMHREKPFDLFFFMDTKIMPYLFLVKTIFRRPVVHWVDSALITDKIFFRLLKNNYSLVDKWVCINQTVFDKLKVFLGSEDKLALIPPPIDCRKYNNIHNKTKARMQLGIPERKTILFSGSLQTGRGVDLCVEIFNTEFTEDSDWQLLICHVDNPWELDKLQILKRKIQATACSSRIIVLGKLQDRNLLYNSADLAVLPYTQKSSITPPLTLLEMMAAGLPVITTDVKEVETRSVIKNGYNGFICSNDIKSLSETLFLAMQHSDLQTIGSCARGTIKAIFRVEKIGTSLVEIFHSCLPISRNSPDNNV